MYILRSQIPDYLRGSELYKSLNLDDDEIDVGRYYPPETEDVNNMSDFRLLFHIYSYWDAKLPLSYLKYIEKNRGDVLDFLFDNINIFLALIIIKIMYPDEIVNNMRDFEALFYIYNKFGLRDSSSFFEYLDANRKNVIQFLFKKYDYKKSQILIQYAMEPQIILDIYKEVNGKFYYYAITITLKSNLIETDIYRQVIHIEDNEEYNYSYAYVGSGMFKLNKVLNKLNKFIENFSSETNDFFGLEGENYINQHGFILENGILEIRSLENETKISINEFTKPIFLKLFNKLYTELSNNTQFITIE